MEHYENQSSSNLDLAQFDDAKEDRMERDLQYAWTDVRGAMVFLERLQHSARNPQQKKRLAGMRDRLEVVSSAIQLEILEEQKAELKAEQKAAEKQGQE